MSDSQDNRKRKLAALKARREQSIAANAALANQEEERFGSSTTVEILAHFPIICVVLCCGIVLTIIDNGGGL